MSMFCFYITRFFPISAKSKVFNLFFHLMIRFLKFRLKKAVIQMEKIQDYLCVKTEQGDLDCFGRVVAMVENLAKRLQTKDTWSKVDLMNSLCYLDECEFLCKKLSFFFLKKNLKGVASKLISTKTFRSYCYCCSQPMFRHFGDKMRIVCEGSSQHVRACSSCHESLNNSKSLNILHFMIDEQRYHWSKVADYSPSWEYWQMNSISWKSKTGVL